MSSGLDFFIIVTITVVITRVFLFITPMASPTIGKFRIHHFMYGAVLGIAGLGVDNMVLYAVGMGLFLDEATYLLIGGKSHSDNYSTLSLLGTAVLLIATYVARNSLASAIR